SWVTCIASEIYPACGRLDHVASPKHSAATEESPARPVLRGNIVDAYSRLWVPRFPPVKLNALAKSFSSQIPTVSQSSHEGRIPPVAKPPQTWQIHVIVMVVAQENQIDARQALQGNTRIAHAFRAGPADRTGTLGEVRIGEDIQTAKLE